MSSIKTNLSAVNIRTIKAFSDNYIWAITGKNNNSNKTALVDPGDASVCIKFLEENKLTLTTILVTHHHPDHSGGIEKLVTYCQEKQWPLTVYGPATENIPGLDIKLEQDDIIDLPEIAINFTVIDLPGHTAGHIAYFAINSAEPILFCGDTLFSGGCGRLFEGTAKQMLTSLTKLANLPENTAVYCAHEYTQANLMFALAVDPENKELINYSKQVNELRAKEQSTIPTSINIEKKINPFLRSHKQSIQASALLFDKSIQANSLDTFTTIRRWKDQF